MYGVLEGLRIPGGGSGQMQILTERLEISCKCLTLDRVLVPSPPRSTVYEKDIVMLLLVEAVNCLSLELRNDGTPSAIGAEARRRG